MSLASPSTKPVCYAVVMRATTQSGRGQPIATKVLRRTEAGFEVEAEPRVAVWHWDRVGLDGLDDIEAMLRRLAGDPSAIVVGEDVREGAGAVVNRVLVDPEDESGKVPDLRRRDRRWLALDCDGWTPPGWPLSSTPTDADIRAAVRALVDTLGPAFEGVECVYRLSATAGLVERADGDPVRVPGWQRLRCHVWLWLDRPVAPASVKGWLGALSPLRKNAKGRMEPVDPMAPHWDHGMLDGARVHYVADPVCEGAGIGEVVPVSRIGRLPGRAVVAPVTWRTLAEMAADEARANAEGAAYLATTRTASRLARVCWGYALGVIETKLTWTSKGKRAGSSPDVFGWCRKAFSSAAAAEQAGRAGSVDEVEGILLARGVKSRTARAARVEGLKSEHVARSVQTAQARIDDDDALAAPASPATKPMQAVEAVLSVEAANDDAEPDAELDEVEELDIATELAAYDAWAEERCASAGLTPSTPSTVADVLRGVVEALDRDAATWSAELVETLGGRAQAVAASSAGVGVVGERCRAFLRSVYDAAPELIRGAGLLTRKGPWPPVAKGAPDACILPVFGPCVGEVVGLYAVDAAGAFLGRLGANVPVGQGWAFDGVQSPATKPLTVVVGDPLDAAAMALDMGLVAPLDPVRVVAVVDEAGVEVREIIARAARVVIARAGAWSRGPEVAAMAQAVGVPVAAVRTQAATWRHRDEEGRAAAVMLWAQRLEVQR